MISRILRGGAIGVELKSNKAIHDTHAIEKLKPTIKIVWSVLVCLLGVYVVFALMYAYFFLAARLLDVFSGYDGSGPTQISPHVIAAFALLGSVVGSAGGGACIGYLAPSSPCSHAAVVGAAFSLLQLKQVTLFSKEPTWFTVTSALPYIPTSVWAAALARREAGAGKDIRGPAAQVRDGLQERKSAGSEFAPGSAAATAAVANASAGAPTRGTQGPASASALAAAAAAAAAEGADTAVVVFRAVASWVGAGRSVAVTGSAPELGGWRVDAGLVLHPDPTAGGGAWQGAARLPPSVAAEYKYVAVGPGGPPAWEALPGNRQLKAPAAGGRLEVRDSCRFGPPQ